MYSQQTTDVYLKHFHKPLQGWILREPVPDRAFRPCIDRNTQKILIV